MIREQLRIALESLAIIRDSNSDMSALADKTIEQIRRINEEMSEMQNKEESERLE